MASNPPTSLPPIAATDPQLLALMGRIGDGLDNLATVSRQTLAAVQGLDAKSPSLVAPPPPPAPLVEGAAPVDVPPPVAAPVPALVAAELPQAPIAAPPVPAPDPNAPPVVAPPDAPHADRIAAIETTLRRWAPIAEELVSVAGQFNPAIGTIGTAVLAVGDKLLNALK